MSITSSSLGGTKVAPEQIRAVRRHHARILAQVNRIWAAKGASNFLQLPSDYQLDQEDMKHLKEEETRNNLVRIALMKLPNGWDEGDLSSKEHGNGSPNSSTRKTGHDIEQQAENFLQLSYHLHNYYANPRYRLPPILKPTPLQESTPHDPVIDPIPYPSIRDKLVQDPSLDEHSIAIDLIRFISPLDAISIRKRAGP